jgi:hypothetical protein
MFAWTVLSSIQAILRSVHHLVVARHFLIVVVPAFSLQDFDPGIVQRTQ